MRLILFIFCCLCACCIRVQAQTGAGDHYHLYLKNGLPSNHIYEAQTDTMGFLWICTDNGVVKYNGYSCKVFTTKDGLPSNDVVRIQEDSRGRMWVFTMSNDAGYIVNDRYHSVFGANKPGRNIRVNSIEEYRGDVYFQAATHNDSVVTYRYDRSGKIWEWRCHEWVRWLFSIVSDEYIIRAGKNFLSYGLPFRNGIPRRGAYNCLYIDKAAFYDYGYKRLLGFRSRSGEYLHIKVAETDCYIYRRRKYLKRHVDKPFVKLYCNSTGYSERHPWGAYLFYRDSVFQVEEDTVVVPVAPNKYGGNATVFIDQGRLRYYATDNEGLFVHIPRSFQPVSPDISFRSVQRWENEYSGTALLKDNVLQQVPAHNLGKVRRCDNGGKILLGTEGAVQWNARRSVYSSIWEGVNHVSLPWPGDIGSKENWRRRSDHEPPDVLFRYTCLEVYDSLHFFLSATQGFFKVSRSRDSAVVSRINSTRFSYMCYDSSLHLLIAYTDNLLCLYHTERGRQVLLKTEQLTNVMPEGLERIHVLGKGHFLVKSHELLLLYDAFRQSYKVLPHFFNLEGSLVTVADGKIFAAGRFGVAVASLDPLMHRNDWKLLPNFKGKDYTKVNDLVITDTAVLLGTDEGVFSASKKALYDAPAFAIDSYFNFFVAGDSIIRVRDGDTVAFGQELSKLVLNANNIYGTGTLSFRYRWKSTNSTFAQTTGDVYVGDMKPGRYYPFTIIAGDDAWHSRSLTVYLYRRPYWYQTQGWVRAFWIGGVFLFLLFVGGVILLTRYFVERKNTKKQQLIELELRALYSQINPHFIFNSLNSAQYFINARDIDKAYDHVSKFARLLRAYLKSSHDRYVTIAEEVNMLHNYVELQQERFREPFSYSIKVDNKIPKDSIQIPSLLLQPLVENAINHGLFHKKGQGHLSIEFLQGHNHEEIVCIIEDDGIGREKAKEISKANAASRYGSYGTKLTEQLIDIFERYEQMNISVTYTDKKPPLNGTIVTLTIRNVRYVA